MVYREAGKSKTLVIFVTLGMFILSFAFTISVFKFVSVNLKEDEPEIDTQISGIEEPEIIIEKVDFQPIINQWVDATGGKKGIAIYDLDLDEIVGEYNIDTKFQTASLYKLFVVYEGYRKIQNDEWDKDAKAGSTGKTIAKCLDLAIRESHSPCAETLWGMIGRDALDEAVNNDFGITNFAVGSLSATPREIMQMMKIYYDHKEITDNELANVMQDSFLNQPKTTYDWRRGLPSGFSDAVLVYNKVGWEYDGKQWKIYDDAAILDFTKLNRHFIVVIMTNNLAYQQIRNFGSMIEELVSTEEL